MSIKLSRCLNIDDLRVQAKKRLPHALFGYIDGFAEDSVTGSYNRSAFNKYQLVPNMLVDVTQFDTSTTVLGQTISSPLILCPTALTRLFHHEGERAVAAAAKQADITYALSTISSVSIEDIGKIAGPRWFQVYVYKDRGLVKELIERSRQSGYGALCLTVDASVGGNREHDKRNGLVIPPRPGLRTIVEALRHPYWCWHMLTSPTVTTANVIGKSGLESYSTTSMLKYVHEQIDLSVTWDDVSWMMEQWDGPFLIKGILSVGDAKRAADLGVNGIVVSNHGGRQLDHAPASLQVLPDIVEAVGDRCDIILDSGIRRGTDVMKALALGAKACMIGRPYLYGLAAAGQPGVAHAIGILQEEIKRNMMLMGCRNLSELDKSYLRIVSD